MAERKLESELRLNWDAIVQQAALIAKAKGDDVLADILVNADVRFSDDGYDESTYSEKSIGYSIFVKIPGQLFVTIKNHIEATKSAIKSSINDIASGFVPGEYVLSVGIGIKDDIEHWRERTGLLRSGGQRIVTEQEQSRIWKADCGLKVFISHKDEDKEAAAYLAKELYRLGISAFVAHRDIINSSSWPVELSNALNSMDACVALLTENFHGSYWTDQEVGWALGRNIKVIPVNLGADPYGFMGVIQAKRVNFNEMIWLVFEALKELRGWKDSLIHAVARCPSFDFANYHLWPYVRDLGALMPQQLDSLVSAANSNEQITYSHAFAGTSQDGRPLTELLIALTGKKYKFFNHQWFADDEQPK